MPAEVIRANFRAKTYEMPSGQEDAEHFTKYGIEEESYPLTATERNPRTPVRRPIVNKFKVGRPKEPPPTIDTKALYPDSEEPEPSYMVTVVRLLLKGLSYLRKAVEASKTDDWFASDNEVMLFRNLLPELFCCRRLGDGFGAVINALNFALKNSDDEPLTMDQISTIYDIVEHLYHRPLLPFPEAVKQIDSLRKNGLNPRPIALDQLADISEQTD